MRRPLTICLAVTAALVLPAAASADNKFYGGKIESGGKIGLNVELAGGNPIAVTEMRYKSLPANCSTDGPSLIGSTYRFNGGAGLPVANDKFSIDGSDGNGGNLFFKGTFKNGGKKVSGRLQATLHFTMPNQNCVSATRNYSVSRGAKGPHPQIPKALKVG